MSSLFDEGEEVEREPCPLPDFFIEATAVCGVCKRQNTVEHPLLCEASERLAS
ncbi:MAG: hypothetical protein JO183_02600 [Ktedonobacteraceae bacterium]|nr:hypothetical protein [Ktedonobacteraceae bacterium]